MERQYRRQSEFTDKVLKKLYEVNEPGGLSTQELIDYTQKMVLSIHREADELLDEIPWKHHRLYEAGDIVRSNVLEELIDLIKFPLSCARAYGFTAQELVEAFDDKSTVVEDRWRQEQDSGGVLSNIVLVDLDGVLSEYPDPFLNFVYQETGTRYLTIEELEEKAPALKHEMKHIYRQSGIKRDLPPIVSNIVACQMLDAAGYNVVIMSQRPYQDYGRIYGDTVFWLKKHHVPYKRLLFVPDKGHRLLLSPMKHEIVFAVDDDVDVVTVLEELGIKTYHCLGPVENVDGLSSDEVESMLQVPEVTSSTRSFQKVVRGK